MPRGRRAKPAEVKALLGNPGKRRLALNDATDGKRAPAPPPVAIDPPAFLTQDAEKKAFADVLRALPPNLVRRSDLNALGRWAAWLCVWVTCKLALDGKKHWYTTTSEHSPEIHREHPLAKRMDKAEAHLVTLEDRLCLNIQARNNVMHRILNAPPAHPGAGLFADDEPNETDKGKTDGAAAAIPPPEMADHDPLGFMERAGKPH